MTILETKIRNFTDSIYQSIESENYFAALTLALTLPDILGKLEYHYIKDSTARRYSKWFNENLKEKYSMELFGEKHVFLSGTDAYALRCAFLHGGESDISAQKAQKIIESFIFKSPEIIDGKTFGSHTIKVNNKLVLRIDIFCEDICKAATQWAERKAKNSRINNSAAKMMAFQQGIIITDGVRID